MHRSTVIGEREETDTNSTNEAGNGNGLVMGDMKDLTATASSPIAPHPSIFPNDKRRAATTSIVSADAHAVLKRKCIALENEVKRFKQEWIGK